MGIIKKLQAKARGKLMRIEFQKMINRVRAARCIQRNIRKFVQFRDWHWRKLYMKVKPLLNVVKAEDQLREKDAEISDIKGKFEKEEQLRKDYESKCVSLLSEKNNLTLQLQAEQENLADSEKLNEEMSQDLESAEGNIKRLDKEKNNLERKVRCLSSDLDSKDGSIATLQKEKKHIEQV